MNQQDSLHYLQQSFDLSFDNDGFRDLLGPKDLAIGILQNGVQVYIILKEDGTFFPANKVFANQSERDLYNKVSDLLLNRGVPDDVIIL